MNEPSFRAFTARFQSEHCVALMRTSLLQVYSDIVADELAYLPDAR